MDIREHNFQQFLEDMECRRYQMHAKPLDLMFGLTNVCNLHCTFCPYCGTCMKKTERKQEIELSILEKLKEYFSTGKFCNPSLRGEPFLYSHIEEFFELCKENGILEKTQLINNGTQLHKHDLKSLEGINIVSISFDASDKKTFEILRTGANFERVLLSQQRID